MECARPGQQFRVEAERAATARSEDLLRATRHLKCGAASESQQQQLARIDAAEDQARDPIRQGLGLAGARSRCNQQWWRSSAILANTISDSTLPRQVQPLILSAARAAATVFRFCSTIYWIALPMAEGNRANLRMRRRPFDQLQHANSPERMGFCLPDSHTVPPTAWSRLVFAIPRTLDVGDVQSANRPELAK